MRLQVKAKPAAVVENEASVKGKLTTVVENEASVNAN